MTVFLRHLRRCLSHYLVIALVALIVYAAVAYFFSIERTAPSQPQPSVEIVVATSSENERVLPESMPGTLRIPAIGLSTGFVAPLGLQENGEVEVPAVFDRVGWYKYSPTPGELGPAIILGHVDSRNGPAIFYDLHKLKPGDEVLIEREDGSVATFIVERSEEYSQSAFPADAVYGNIDHAGLRLVTCSGTYDRGIERYSHNLVVYARLASSTAADGISE